ncbi:fam-b protein [Plasmodium vinckei vinckei]|uniref:Fam-b protein n=1 Tax=Plasmodium vinckei vinckei TaxID=54757 RepID=A0A449BNY6_PLAVN|nr:fam-b protein [Plasmodium vinckei vinckei]VEV55098.1 fam-b protein [Plasmodium vinckei vinckei]
MRVSIFKFAFFSIIICSFEYVQNELYFIYERNIYIERNIINFKNNRILTDADSQFDLNDFYQSSSSLESQFNGCNGDYEEIKNLQDIIDSHIKKREESNTTHILNNANEETKKIIQELRKELEEAKKQLDSINSNELEIQPIHNKRKVKKEENISASEHENILERENDNFENKYDEIASNDIYKEIQINKNPKKKLKKNVKNRETGLVSFSNIIKSKSWHLVLLLTPKVFSSIKNFWKNLKIFTKKSKKSK